MISTRFIRTADGDLPARRGVILLEAMISLVILSASGLAILGAISAAHTHLWLSEVINSGVRARETLMDEILLEADIAGILGFNELVEARGSLTEPFGELSPGAVQIHTRSVTVQPTSILLEFAGPVEVDGVMIIVSTSDEDGWGTELRRFVPTGMQP